VADYLATQNDLFARFHAARSPAEREKIVNDLVHHADRHRQLIDQMARYQTTHGAEDRAGTTPPRRRTTPAKATKASSTGPKTTSRGGSRRSP
jgi:hypothetical protein